MPQHEQIKCLTRTIEGTINGAATQPVTPAHRFRLAWATINLYSHNSSIRKAAENMGRSLAAKFPETLQEYFGDCIQDGRTNNSARSAFGYAGYPEGFLLETPYTEFQRQYSSVSGLMGFGAGAFRPHQDVTSTYLTEEEAHDLACAVTFHYQEGLWREEAEHANEAFAKLDGREKVEWLVGLLAGSPESIDFFVDSAGKIQFDAESIPCKPEPTSSPSM